MDFSVIKKAGITCAESAKMVGVSNVIMWKYINGKAKPREEYNGLPIRHRIDVLLRILGKLVENGSLPKIELRHAPRMDPEKKARRERLVAKIQSLLEERVAAAPTNK